MFQYSGQSDQNQYKELEYMHTYILYIKEDFTFNTYVNIYLHTYVHCICLFYSIVST